MRKYKNLTNQGFWTPIGFPPPPPDYRPTTFTHVLPNSSAIWMMSLSDYSASLTASVLNSDG